MDRICHSQDGSGHLKLNVFICVLVLCFYMHSHLIFNLQVFSKSLNLKGAGKKHLKKVNSLQSKVLIELSSKHPQDVSLSVNLFGVFLFVILNAKNKNKIKIKPLID